MTGLKIQRLPDRTPVKMMVALSPELNASLGEYALAYEEAYGERVSMAELIPAILEAFIAGDRAFGRRRKLSLRRPVRQQSGRPDAVQQ